MKKQCGSWLFLTWYMSSLYGKGHWETVTLQYEWKQWIHTGFVYVPCLQKPLDLHKKGCTQISRVL